jgi:hypothetical protein
MKVDSRFFCISFLLNPGIILNSLKIAYMKRFICLSLIVLILSASPLLAQSVMPSADKIESVLCKKWTINYALIGGMKIGQMPGAANADYDFKADKTFFIIDEAGGKTKGSWQYDEKKKVIKLTVNGKNMLNVISLKDTELIVLADTKEATPDDPMELKLVYKIK